MPKTRNALSLSALSLLAACGEPAGGPAVSQSGAVSAYEPVARVFADVDADAGKLIPASPLVVARVRGIEGVTQEAKAIAEAFQRGAGNFVDVAPLAAMAGLRPRDLDMTGSLLVAVGMTPMGPMPSFVVPAANAQDAADVASMPSAVSGKFLGLGMAEAPVVGTSVPALGQKLSAADVALRVDLKSLLAMFRSSIDPYLDPNMLAGMDPTMRGDPASEAMVGIMLDRIKNLLDSAEQLDVAVSLDGGALDLDVGLRVSGNTLAAPAGRAITLTQLLPMTDASMYLLFDADWSSVTDMLMPLYDSMADAMPAEQGKAFRAMLRSSTELYTSLKGGAVMAADLTADGIQFMGLMESDDPVAFIEQYVTFMKRYPDLISSMTPEGAAIGNPVKVSPAAKSTIDGVEFQTLSVDANVADIIKANPQLKLPPGQLAAMSAFMQTFFGKDGIKVALGGYQSLVLVTAGDTAKNAASLLTSAKTGKRQNSAFVANVAKRLHSRPSYLFGGDIRRFLQQLRPVLTETMPVPMPEVPAGDPVFAWMSMSATADGYGLQAHVDLTGLAGIVKAMNPR